jgi:hypothetical protein
VLAFYRPERAASVLDMEAPKEVESEKVSEEEDDLKKQPLSA